MEVLPHTGGAAFGTLARRLRDGGLVCLVADRDLSASGVEVDFFGETARMPAGPALLAQQTGALLLPVTLWYDDSPVMQGRVHPPVEVPETGTRAEKTSVMTQALADAFAAGIADHPEDWHMLQRLWLADLDPPAEPDGADRVRIGIVCPYSWDVPGRRPVPHPRPGRAPDPARPRGVRPGPGRRRHPAAAVRRLGRPRGPGAVQRLGRPAELRLPVGGPGAALAARRRRSTSSTSTSRPRPSLGLLTCWAAQGPIVATFHTSNPRSRAMIAAYPILQPALEKISARIAVSEYARRTLVEHLGGDAVVIPNGVDVDFFAKRRAQGRVAGRHDRLHRPHRRAPQGPAGADEGPARRSSPSARRRGCWSPGRGDEEEARRVAARGAARAGRVPRHGQRRGQGAAAAQRRRVRRAQHRRRELRHHPRRGHVGGRARCSPATSTPSRRCWTRARPASCSPTRTRTRWPRRRCGCWATRSGASELRERGSAHVRRFDWSTVGADILAVYETVTDGAAAVAADERHRAARPSRARPGLSPRGPAARPAARRRR